MHTDDVTVSFRASYDEAFIMASDPLEGFHEVNLASPTTPDLLGVNEPGTQEQTTSPSVIYRPHPSLVSTTQTRLSFALFKNLPSRNTTAMEAAVWTFEIEPEFLYFSLAI